MNTSYPDPRKSFKDTGPSQARLKGQLEKLSADVQATRWLLDDAVKRQIHAPGLFEILNKFGSHLEYIHLELTRQRPEHLATESTEMSSG